MSKDQTDATTPEYDIAISYAGEDRRVAAQIAEALRSRDVHVFYDQFERAKSWGTNLHEELAGVYGQKSKFCLMLISAHYASNAWTTVERQFAQARAFREKQPYILPVRLDDTAIPGIAETIVYIDLRSTTIGELVELVLERLETWADPTPTPTPRRKTRIEPLDKLGLSPDLTTARKTSRQELRRFFRQWLDTAFQNKLLDRNNREAMFRGMEKYLPAIVEELNVSGKGSLPLGASASYEFYLREGRDPDYGRFNLYEIRRKGMPPHPRLRCFLGHRFLKPLSNALRMNLRHVLEPSSVELIWSGIDILAVGFFDNIIHKIQQCDFCIFDNRMASEKPNVYIEAGIAYALRKPFIFANYQGNRVGIPSDLTHILGIPYRSYEDLCRTLYFNLPVFLRDTGLRVPPSDRQ